MKIETKFNVGDKCCLLKENRIVIGVVRKIKTVCYAGAKCETFCDIEIKSGKNCSQTLCDYNEQILFKTKEELVEDLLKQ